MVGSFFRLAATAAFCAMLAGCAGAPGADDASFSGNTPRVGAGASIAVPEKPLQCVPYARAHSGVDIRGDAYTWWDKAAGKYQRSGKPSEGAVLVLAGYSNANRAHVAVVRRVVSPREIRIDHANWLNNGAIYLDDPVADISPDNDWSQVRVWNIETRAWGTHTYDVQGFIGPGRGGDNNRVAMRAPDDDEDE
jgi:CHAP domain-containing protein